MLLLILIAIVLVVVAAFGVARHRKLSRYKNALKSPHRQQRRR